MPSRSPADNGRVTLPGEVILDRPEVFLVDRLGTGLCCRIPVRLDELARGGLRRKPRRTRLREQARDELRAVGRQLEQRLVHQLQVQIAAADVDDEGHPRLERGDVGEILFGADAEEHAMTAPRVCDRRNDVAIEQLIGDEVVGRKKAVVLGKFLGQPPEVFVRQRRGELGTAGNFSRSGPRTDSQTDISARRAARGEGSSRHSDARGSGLAGTRTERAAALRFILHRSERVDEAAAGTAPAAL